jgi:hypothetical protein
VGATVSEAVALRHPVMPVTNGFGSGLVGINGNQLRSNAPRLIGLPGDFHRLYAPAPRSHLTPSGRYFWSFPAPLEMSGRSAEPGPNLSGIVWNMPGVV